ncbi:MAG: hypothetical protein H0U90_10260 [Actinobacteria bacterium]|nr:hypothetical protein [Actinomycetota bacterium]
MSVDERTGSDRMTTADIVAGFLAAAALFAGILTLVWYPGRVGPAAMLVALIAAALGTGSQRRLAGLALAVVGICWLLGMAIAVITERPVF